MIQNSDIVRYTTCSYHCLNTCILKVRIRDGIVVAIEPDDTINAGVTIDEAYLPAETIRTRMVQRRPCAKGYAWRQMLYDPNRVKYPMKRIGERGTAKFERISWNEALDTIADKLVETKEKYGPFSIMHHPYSAYGRTSFPLAPWFGAGIACWQVHSTGGWHQPVLWVLGKDEPIDWTTQDEDNIFASNLIVLWGMNPLTTWNGGTANNTLLRARKSGIPIICIDARYTMSAEILADQWIPIRPTTDVAMVLAMANVFFKEDLVDHTFIDRYVEPEGLMRWKAYVLGETDGLDKTPQWAEGICGVPAETIAEFARLYTRSKPVNLIASLTLGRQFFGENQSRAMMYLQALTGNTVISGGTAAAQTGLWFGRGTQVPSAGGMIMTPVVDWRQKPGDYTAPVLMAIHKWPKAVDFREKLDAGKMNQATYNNLIGNQADNPAPNIQMVIAESNNHGVTLPDINATIRALKKTGFNLVWSQYTDMAIARYADILLPMPYTSFEGRNIVRWNLFAGTLHTPNVLIYRQKCVDMPGEVKPNDWVWTQIARRLGLAELYNPRMADVPDEQWEETIEALNKEAYEEWIAQPDIAALGPPSWEAFQKKPVFHWPMPDEPIYPFKDDLEAGRNPFRGTSSGKLEFFSKELAKGGEYLSTHAVPAGSGRAFGPGNLPPMAQMTMGGKGTFYSQETQTYPLLMSSPHSYYRVHSQLDNSPLLRGDCYRHAVWISVADAKTREIMDGDMVRVYNDMGEMVLPAYVTSRIVPGNVAIHHGAWYEPEPRKTALMPEGVDRRGAPNLLTKNEDLPETIVGFFQCKGLVQIEKWEDV